MVRMIMNKYISAKVYIYICIYVYICSMYIYICWASTILDSIILNSWRPVPGIAP